MMMEENKLAAAFDLTEFFQKAPALMCVLDMENRMHQPNEAWTRVTGHPVAQLHGALVDDFLHPDDSDPARRTSRISLEAQGAIVQESRFRCADGSYRWIEWTMRVIFERALVFCCARAIEQPRRATITSARRLETYLRRAPVAMIEIDVESGITEWSKGAETMFGFTRSEAVGKQLVDFLVPEHLRTQAREVSSSLRDGSSSVGRAVIGLNITKSGKLIHCEWHNAPLTDDEGKVRAFLSIALDRSEIEAQRARAEESVARFDMLMRGSRSGFWDYMPRDPANPVDVETPVFLSEGLVRMLGVAAENMPKTLNEFYGCIHLDDRGRVAKEFEEHIGEHRAESYLEYRILHADGSPVWVGATWYALWNDKGGLVRFAGSFADITERKLAEEDQREKIALIERQANAIRELSTPILEVQEGVLCLPIIGVVDSARAAEMMNMALGAVVSEQARFLIIDLTGVPVLDTSTADRLLAIARAAGLVGAQTVITGLQPAVAQTVVTLGVGMGEVKTLRNLKDGLRYCSRQKNK
jgi:rsbT co-antagonist protein RsbR